MRCRNTTNRDTMGPNPDLILRVSICQSLNCLLPCPLKHKLHILSNISWSGCTSATGVSSVVPQDYVDSVVKIKLEPLV